MRILIPLVAVILLLIGFALVCHAQTNTESLPAVSSVTQPGLIDAITKLVEAIGSLGAAVLILARLLRKVIPDEWQTGKLGDVLKHGSLEINPQLTPTPPNVPNPAVVLKDVATGAPVEPVKNPNP